MVPNAAALGVAVSGRIFTLGRALLRNALQLYANTVTMKNKANLLTFCREQHEGLGLTRDELLACCCMLRLPTPSEAPARSS